MATCQICKYGGRPKDNPPCSDCKGYSNYEYEKLCTNGDRIRAMSDEELAWELMTWRLETEAKHQGIESNYPNTQKSILEWLKQPAEDANPFHYEKGCQPHGAEQFAKACAVCVNSGSDLCRDCKAEKKSGFEPPF